tara:strand:+ start:931 stop:1509 length:579 start_codon:yes stop_codon:yes gene_type:complete
MDLIATLVQGIVQVMQAAQPLGALDPKSPFNQALKLTAGSHPVVPEACQGSHVTDQALAVFGSVFVPLSGRQQVVGVAAAQKVFSSLVELFFQSGRCLAKAVKLLLLGFGHAVGLLGLTAATCAAVLVAGLGAVPTGQNTVVSLVQGLKRPAFVLVSESGVSLGAVASLALIHQSDIGASNQAVLVAAATNG